MDSPKKIADSAPVIDDFLTSEASDFFAAVTAGLDAAGVAWERAPRLVRGLDYYRHTAFEFITDQLGSQGTVLAGGRYDGLIESLGGPHTPAVGWAAGIERLAMLMERSPSETLDLAIVADAADAELLSVELAGLLRREGLSATLFNSGKIKKRFDRALNVGASAVLAVSRAQNGPENHFLIRWRPTDLGGTFELKQRIEGILRQRFKFDRPNELIVGWGEMSRSQEVE